MPFFKAAADIRSSTAKAPRKRPARGAPACPPDHPQPAESSSRTARDRSPNPIGIHIDQGMGAVVFPSYLNGSVARNRYPQCRPEVQQFPSTGQEPAPVFAQLGQKGSDHSPFLL